MSSPPTTPRYIPVTLNPIECASRPLWVLHILPLPLPPLLVRKWDYILKRFHVWYQDSDGDDITLGSSTELVSAVHELEAERVASVRFRFKKGSLVGQDLLFKMMDELDRVKIRYKVFGFIPGGSSIELDLKTKKVKSTPPYQNVREHDDFKEQAKLPEEEVDDAILNEPVSEARAKFVAVGKNVHIGDNIKVGTQDREKVTNSVPEHDDLSATPKEGSPAPSPRFEPFANNDTPLIDLGSNIATLPPEEAPDPPDEVPSESSFPGSFPTGVGSGASTAQFIDWQSLISATIQRTLDQLTRLGHITINAAQNSGFPVSSADSFDSARRTLDDRTSSVRAQLDNTSANLRQNLARARTDLQSALDNARQQINSARSGAQHNLSSGLVAAASSLGNAGRQVEQAIARATTSVQASGAVSQTAADRFIGDLRSGAERIEHAMEDMTLRLQRLIDSYALGLQMQPSTSASNSMEEEDIYGRAPSTLPGSFPVEPSGTDQERKVRECANRLIEMGFFSSDNRESAMAVAVATEGDLESAIDVMDGRHSNP